MIPDNIGRGAGRSMMTKWQLADDRLYDRLPGRRHRQGEDCLANRGSRHFDGPDWI